MNYRHGYHAGNFADVVKHVALVAILLHLRKKDTPFAVIDSHAGRGLYDLSGEMAAKTGEAQSGIGRLRDLAPPLPEALETYLKLAAESGADRYPGSPLIAAKLARPQDRLVAVEKHPEEAAVLAATLHPFRKASVENADGYVRLVKLVPPPERRGLVLIDPPFEATDEFEVLARAVRHGLRRFATGCYAIWYPIKDAAPVASFFASLAEQKYLRMELDLGPRTPDGKLAACGVVVINPPWKFEESMRESLPWIAARLGEGARSTFFVSPAEAPASS